MPVLAFDTFKGLDTRRSPFAQSLPLLTSCDNLDLAAGGLLRTRPALRKYADLHAQSVGLYQRGGYLRAVIPGGHSYQGLAPTGFVYDGIGIGTVNAYPLSKIQRLVAAETWGATAPYGPNGYLAIQRNDTFAVEHHYITAPPASFATPIDTRVALPFIAGPALTKLKNKFFAPDPVNGVMRFSSTVNGPTDWEAVGDAGFLPVSNNVAGSRDLEATGIHRGHLAVLYRDAIQLWSVDEDPELMQLDQVLNGPGTFLPGSVVNVLGDITFLSHGGFRNLQTVIVTGQSDEQQMGSPIKTLTAGITDAIPAAALWSQTRNQMLCAIGTKVFVWTFLPTEQVVGWTTWTLPVAIDYLTELDGVIYARSGNTAYVFDDGLDVDFNGAKIAFSGQFVDWPLGSPGYINELLWLTIAQSAPATWTPTLDSVPHFSRHYPAGTHRHPLGGQARRYSLGFNGVGAWRLDGFAVDSESLGV